MEVLDLALRYMEIFYSGSNIDTLRPYTFSTNSSDRFLSLLIL